jgi:hypothetical protein
MYVVACIVLLIGKLSDINSAYPKSKIIGWLLLLGWFFIFCFLLQARTALIFLIIYSLVAMPYILIRKGKMKHAVIGLLGLVNGHECGILEDTCLERAIHFDEQGELP